MSNSTALMVIDVQRDVVKNALRTEAVVGNINSLIAKARSAGAPVIWVQHSDDYLVLNSEGWEFVPELTPLEGDDRIYKLHASSFEETDLLQKLEARGVKKLIITGAQTDYCVNATSNAAVELGFAVTLVSDAHTTEDTPTKSAEELISEKNQQFAALADGKSEVLVLPESLVNI